MNTTNNMLAEQKAALRARMAELRTEIESVKAISASKQAELDGAIAEQNALDAKVATLAAEVDAIEQPRLHELKMELGLVAQAESAIRVSQ